MMTKDEIQKVIANYLVGKPVLRAYLFGSYARGEAGDDSDIDVLVELDYANRWASFDNWCNMQDELGMLFQKKIDLVSAKGLSRFIAPYIHADKKLIYERSDRRTAA